MTSRAGKFGAAFLITRDERAQLAEELMASIDRDDDDDDEVSWRPAREEIELRYAEGAEEDAPVSDDDRWGNASGQVRLTRST
jgi:hypothetical protein